MDIYGYHILYVPCMIQKINAYKILVGQPEDETPLGRTRRKLKNMNEEDLDEIERQSVG